ncbi:hypothetical protein U9M48_004504 [Paspalum notatum var. saurae]|uniref:Uncharacterized protein n=1 Tax=Paspalum notatum var. saurae TaxID=547442 RepID=A0AAQ3PUX0_PASNO
MLVRPSTSIFTFFILEALFRDASTKTLFEMAHGVPAWSLMKTDTPSKKDMNESLVLDSSFIVDVDSKEIFGGRNSLVDVGGGYGGAAKAIARAFPHINCSVLDIEQAPSDGTVLFMSGNMFESIPTADASFLNQIILIGGTSGLPDKQILLYFDSAREQFRQEMTEEKWSIGQFCFREATVVRYVHKSVWWAEREHKCRKIFLEAGLRGYKITPVLGKNNNMSCSQKEVSTLNLHRGYIEMWHSSLFHIKSTALLCVVGLGIPSAIHKRGGAATVSDIVAKTDVHPSKLPYLRRLMRMLTLSGIFAANQTEKSEPIYKLTPVSQILVQDRASNSYDVSGVPRMLARPSTCISTFFSLEAWFRDASTKTLFEMAHGVPAWSLMKNDALYNKDMNESLVLDSSFIVDIMLKEVDSKEIFDVGGGHGGAAKAIARAFPHIKCSVLDLEQVISQAPSDDTVMFISGNMFESIPTADACFLKAILDCWNDDDCVKILRQCKRAIPARDDGGKVIIMNFVIGDGAQDNVILETQLLFDMFVMRYGGAEREEHEWRKIFLEAGFSGYKITHEGLSTQKLHRGYIEMWHNSLFHIKSTGLLCVVGLGIPSAIQKRGGAATVSEIVTETGVHPSKLPYLRRLMRMLTLSGIFAADHTDNSEPIYKLTPMSHLLVQDSASNSYDMSGVPRMLARPSTSISTFFSLEAWFKDASTMTLFEMAHGAPTWSLTKNDASYNKGMNGTLFVDSCFFMDILLKEVGSKDIFGGLKSLVDVGGGHGGAAKAIARAFPHIKCSVLDLKQVISQAPSDGMVQFISGNMFESIPTADAAFLKAVLNCWNDDDCVKILRQCKRAIPARDAGGKVIIMNFVIGDGAEDNVVLETQLLFDMFMMRYGGAEREEHEWRRIFHEAGFSDYKITPILGFQSIIEVFP